MHQLGEQIALQIRTRNVCEELVRYEGCLYHLALVKAVENIASINEELNHASGLGEIAREIIDIKRLLDDLFTELKEEHGEAIRLYKARK